MRTSMLAMTVCALAGCRESFTIDIVLGDPFDGQYRVAVSQVENTCDGVGVGDDAPGLTTRLDLFRRSDGTYDLRWVDGWVPEAFAFRGVVLGDGRVDHGRGGPEEVRGNVTADAVDLTLVRRSVRHEDGAPCARRLVVKGERRPMFSLESTDGRYIVTVEHRGTACPDGTTTPGAGSWNMRMEVLPFRDDRTSIAIHDARNGQLRFWIEPLKEDGMIRLTRDLFFTAGPHGGITRLDGSVDGIITPAGVSFEAEVYPKDAPSACRTSYAVYGDRWLPSAGSVTAEYRASYLMTDSCDPEFRVAYEDVAQSVLQEGGRLDLIDREIQSTVGFDGLNVSAAFGEGGSLTYRGSVRPDFADYVVEDRYASGGRTCLFTLAVSGPARYVTRQDR